LKVFLLDADVIIWCAEKKKLDALFKNKKIQIPQVIFDQSINYMEPITKAKKTILFDKYIDDGSLVIVDNPISKEILEIENTYMKCPELAEIHDGEAECIALLLSNREYSFCTGDTYAMEVIGFWGCSEQAISLEELIGKVKNIQPNFTKDCMELHLKKGSILSVQYSEWD